MALASTEFCAYGWLSCRNPVAENNSKHTICAYGRCEIGSRLFCLIYVLKKGEEIKQMKSWNFETLGTIYHSCTCISNTDLSILVYMHCSCAHNSCCSYAISFKTPILPACRTETPESDMFYFHFPWKHRSLHIAWMIVCSLSRFKSVLMMFFAIKDWAFISGCHMNVVSHKCGVSSDHVKNTHACMYMYYSAGWYSSTHMQVSFYILKRLQTGKDKHFRIK